MRPANASWAGGSGGDVARATFYASANAAAALALDPRAVDVATTSTIHVPAPSPGYCLHSLSISVPEGLIGSTAQIDMLIPGVFEEQIDIDGNTIGLVITGESVTITDRASLFVDRFPSAAAGVDVSLFVSSPEALSSGIVSVAMSFARLR